MLVCEFARARAREVEGGREAENVRMYARHNKRQRKMAKMHFCYG